MLDLRLRFPLSLGSGRKIRSEMEKIEFGRIRECISTMKKHRESGFEVTKAVARDHLTRLLIKIHDI